MPLVVRRCEDWPAPCAGGAGAGRGLKGLLGVDPSTGGKGAGPTCLRGFLALSTPGRSAHPTSEKGQSRRTPLPGDHPSISARGLCPHHLEGGTGIQHLGGDRTSWSWKSPILPHVHSHLGVDSASALQRVCSWFHIPWPQEV